MLDDVFSETPSLFGTVHIVALVLIALVNIAIYFPVRNLDEGKLLSILNKLGLFMIVAEVFKQWFCYVYVFEGELNLWFFPWQLCSMAMYLSFAAIYLKGKLRTAALVFLATYSLFADIVALALPYDMLRPQIPLVMHSFAYHGLVITESMIAILILSKSVQGRRATGEEPRFLPATILFLAMVAVAEIINVVAHAILNDIYVEPNMFYITPAYPTTQPILHDIAVNYGIPVEIALYLGLLILMSYIVFVIERKLISSLFVLEK